MRLYSNQKYTPLCISKLGAMVHTVSVATAKLYKLILHRVVAGAQVSLILCLQYQFCSLSLSLTFLALKKVCAGKYTVRNTHREPWRQKNRLHTH